jgi:hypothetical protein
MARTSWKSSLLNISLAQETQSTDHEKLHKRNKARVLCTNSREYVYVSLTYVSSSSKITIGRAYWNSEPVWRNAIEHNTCIKFWLRFLKIWRRLAKILVYYTRHGVKYLLTHFLYLETFKYNRVWCPLGLKPLFNMFAGVGGEFERRLE